MRAAHFPVLFCALFTALFAAADDSALTLYSYRHYPSDTQLYETFTERTGIAVNVVQGSADELIERMKAEGANSPADIFITADAGRLVRAKAEGLLQPIASETLRTRIPEKLRDPEDAWFGFTQRARIIVYAKDRVDPAELSTYEALTDEKWRGRILARSSSHIYNQSLLASIIAAHGVEAATEWARGVRANMARPPQGSDRDQMRAVVAGLGDIALVNTYYVGLLVNSSSAEDQAVGNALGVFFPNQEGRGAHMNISGAGVTKASDNSAGAQRLLEFLVSDEAQAVFPSTTSEFPVVPSVPKTELLESWGTFKVDPLNVAQLGELNATAVRCFDLAGWE